MNQAQEVYKVVYDEMNGFVTMKWNGYATSSQFRDGTEKMLQLLTENKASKVLADTLNMDIIGLEDQKWLESDFIPRAVRHGFKAIALVKPIHYFNTVALESLSVKARREKVQIKMFTDLKSASDWLSGISLR